jgi:riboflavin biosynthesis pyrimidine reductase
VLPARTFGGRNARPTAVNGSVALKLESLFEVEGLQSSELPRPLLETYGSFGLKPRCLYVNFVSSVDGVVAIPGLGDSPRTISRGSSADRFVMGLLRSFADAVLVGAATVAASPGALFTAEQVFPAAADAFRELRRLLGKPSGPQVAIATGSGGVSPSHPVVANGALVLTSRRGAARLARALPDPSQIVCLGDETDLDAAAIVGALHDRGHMQILSEGGARMLGSLLEANVVDELFLTVSPVLVGRTDHDGRLNLVEGLDMLGERPTTRLTLASVRRHADHLFLRYQLHRQLGTPHLRPAAGEYRLSSHDLVAGEDDSRRREPCAQRAT